ncbi:MAG: hypothetical protein II360_01850 [Muribaculaceae bacterium]|nr:hypothetical protein [Muribaculaceae bacterium]
MLRCMKKLLVAISFLTLFMVAHATVKEVAIEYLTAEQVSPENDGLFGEVNPEQWRLYGGKELQTMNGLNLYDFHARWQDYATCWFTTQDPLAEKYYALSPYIYCAGNPIMLTDPTGMDMCVLLQPDGANGLGHMAILIQNEDGKWSLWSKNGTDENSGIKGNSINQDGKDKDDCGTGTYDSIEEFMVGKDNQKEDNSGSMKYTKGYKIKSSSEEDNAAKNQAKIELDKDYNLIGANCAVMVQKALEAAGKDPGLSLNKNSIPSIQSIILNLIPNNIFKNVVKNNPGELIKQ